MDLNSYDFVIVGAGLSGCVIAERIANELNRPVLLLDKRNHFGGNCYTKQESKTGIEYHVYGPHIFHTSNEKVWNYVNRFGKFSNYVHRGRASYKGKVYSLPINLSTINDFYGVTLNPHEAQRFIEDEIKKEGIDHPANLEEKAISLIGRSLYEAFIRGYTTKQWQTDPKELPSNIITRLPVRYNYNDNYFSDKYQGIPLDGYTKLIERMIKHPNITLMLDTDYFKLKSIINKNQYTIYTGPIDQFFNYQHGRLGWRSVRFEMEVMDVNDYQGIAIMNYSDETIPQTRISEFKHFHPEREYIKDKTLIAREFSLKPDKDHEPYYPIATSADNLMLELYEQDAVKLQKTFFVGRLGTYKYLDMHQAIGAALLCYEKEIKPAYTGLPWIP